jgi:hypothetical protein
LDARGADALKDAVARALVPRFEISRTYLDGRTEVVATAELGQTVTVPAGRLTIRPGSAAIGNPVELRLLPAGSALVSYEPGKGLIEEAK